MKGDPNRNCELWVVTVGQLVQVCTAVAGLSVLSAYPAANLKPFYKCIGNDEELEAEEEEGKEARANQVKAGL